MGKPTATAEVSSATATGSSATSQVRRKTQPLGLNARRVISKRYSLKDAKGRALEEWPDIVRRVVGHVSAAEKDAQKRDSFFNAMTEVMLAREFVPNTPCLVNAGKTNGFAGVRNASSLCVWLWGKRPDDRKCLGAAHNRPHSQDGGEQLNLRPHGILPKQ